jgi:hypothetical protein
MKYRSEVLQLLHLHALLGALTRDALENEGRGLDAGLQQVHDEVGEWITDRIADRARRAGDGAVSAPTNEREAGA